MVVQARGLSWVAEGFVVGMADVSPRMAKVEIAAVEKCIIGFAEDDSELSGLLLAWLNYIDGKSVSRQVSM